MFIALVEHINLTDGSVRSRQIISLPDTETAEDARAQADKECRLPREVDPASVKIRVAELDLDAKLIVSEVLFEF